MHHKCSSKRILRNLVAICILFLEVMTNSNCIVIVQFISAMDFLTGVLFGNHSLNKCLITPFQNCLQMDPTMRLDCAELLDHAYFDRYSTHFFQTENHSDLASVTSWRLCQSRQNLFRENREDLATADRYLELITMETTTQIMFFHFRLVAATFFYVFFKSTDPNYFHEIYKKKRKAANMIGNE